MQVESQYGARRGIIGLEAICCVCNCPLVGGTMYLIFSESMIIPQVADRREDDDFEDWLVAELIDSTNQEHLNGIGPSARGITDLWMLEIAERTGEVWKGRFHVEFNKEDEESLENDSGLEEFISFSLNTNTGEMRFSPWSDPGGADGKSLV
jgi:hypothetical protein